MPHRSKKEDQTEGSRWHNFHFSGKVIICSVLFGLGLILIGSLVFAIGTNDEDTSLPEKTQDEIPTKAPSSFVGPAIIGIGGFIVVVGVVMCLFETQVCRKRGGDASPLIKDKNTDPEIKESDPTAIPSTSQGFDKHHHGDRKKSPSPKKHKIGKKLHTSKDRCREKSPSPRSPPMPIESQKSYLSGSDDTFVTPPNSVMKNTMLLHSNSRDAENQTTASLMKSFTSSGPSWNASTEFQTPATSFKDASCLETGIQTDDLQFSTSTPILDIEHNIRAGFLTPETPPKEQSQKIASGIHKQQSENVLKSEPTEVINPYSEKLVHEVIHNLSVNNSDVKATNGFDVAFHGSKVNTENVTPDDSSANESNEDKNISEGLSDTSFEAKKNIPVEMKIELLDPKSFEKGIFSDTDRPGSEMDMNVVEENDMNSDCILGSKSESVEVLKEEDSNVVIKSGPEYFRNSENSEDVTKEENGNSDVFSSAKDTSDVQNSILSISKNQNTLLENQMPLQETNCIESIESVKSPENSKCAITKNDSETDTSAISDLIESDFTEKESSHEVPASQIECDKDASEVSHAGESS